MKVSVDRHGKEYEYYVGLGHYGTKGVYRAAAFDKEKNELGYISFATMTTAPDITWLYKIYVSPENRGQAVGSALLTVLEAFCHKMGKTKIMAEFNPEDGENETQFKLSEQFYRNNGFSFSISGLKEYVTKIVSPTDRQYIFNKIEGYNVLELKDSSEKQKIAEEAPVM